MNEPCPDPVVESVITKLRGRSTVGVDKYKTTLFDSPESRLAFLIHAQQEAMDCANYLEVLIQRERIPRSKWYSRELIEQVREEAKRIPHRVLATKYNIPISTLSGWLHPDKTRRTHYGKRNRKQT